MRKRAVSSSDRIHQQAFSSLNMRSVAASFAGLLALAQSAAALNMYDQCGVSPRPSASTFVVAHAAFAGQRLEGRHELPERRVVPIRKRLLLGETRYARSIPDTMLTLRHAAMPAEQQRRRWWWQLQPQHRVSSFDDDRVPDEHHHCRRFCHDGHADQHGHEHGHFDGQFWRKHVWLLTTSAQADMLSRARLPALRLVRLRRALLPQASPATAILRPSSTLASPPPAPSSATASGPAPSTRTSSSRTTTRLTGSSARG
jgi:hypothetical protein